MVKRENIGISGSFVACDLKVGGYRPFRVLIKMCEYLRSILLFTLTNMTLAKGRLSKTKTQVS